MLCTQTGRVNKRDIYHMINVPFIPFLIYIKKGIVTESRNVNKLGE